jgi:uncharacterized protein
MFARRVVDFFAALPVDRPKLVLAVFLVVCGAILYPPPPFSLSQEDVHDLDPNDPELKALEEFNEKFGDDEIVLVAFEAADAFTAPILTHLERVTRAALETPTVERVYSLFTVEEFATEGAEMRSSRFLPAVPQTAAKLAAKRAQALADPTWTGFLVAADGTLVTLTAVLRKQDGEVPHRADSAAALRALAERDVPPGVTVHVAGRGALFLDADLAGRRDLERYRWVTALWIGGVLFYVFRSLRSIVISFVAAGASIALITTLFLKSGNPAGMLFTMLPTQIAVICLSDILHVLARAQEDTARGGSRRDALVATMRAMLPACFYTMVTSSIGFLSFNAAGLASLETYGTWTACGIVLSFGVTMMVVPAALALLPARAEPPARFAPIISKSLVEFAVWCLRLPRRGRMIVGASWLAILAVAAVGLTRLEVGCDFTSYLPTDSATARATRTFSEKLAGTSTLEVVLTGPEYAFEEPYAIAELARLESALRADSRVDKTFSVLDFLRRLSAARGEGDSLPADGATLSEAFFLLDGSAEVDRFVTRDRSAARISVRLGAHSTQGPVAVVAMVEGLRATLDPRLALTSTGVSKIFAATSQALVAGQARSLFTSLFWVSLALFVAVRSIRTGIIAMLPNVSPILVTLGTMGWLGIPLDVFTILIGSVALGIAVDDTIHLIARHNEERRAAPRGALERTLRSSGHPAIFTSLLFAGGFAVFLLSSFPPMRSFGALAAFAMIVAMFADLTLLPLLLRDEHEDAS